MHVENYINKYLKRVDGKTVVVTGANSGIGFLISKTLAKLGAHIVMAVRNFAKAENARQDILKEVNDAKIDLIKFDLDDFKALDGFISELTNKYPEFDGLILNAGILNAEPDSVTKQGFPKVVGDNFLSLLYLLTKLKPYLDNRVAPCKVIFQGSLMSRRVTYKVDEINNKNSKGLRSYSVSKAGVENLFYKMASGNKNKNVLYLLAEPGACKTNIYHNLPKWLIPPADLFMSIAFHTALKGSLTALNLMCNDNHDGAILVPRGIGHFSGFPTEIKIPKKVLKNSLVLKQGEKLVSPFVN